MGEGILRKLIREQDRHGEIVVESAGTYPAEGAPASSHTVELAAKDGIDLRGHAARPLTSRMVERADLILALEPEHRDRLVDAFPGVDGKTHLLTTYGDPDGDPLGIADPFGADRPVYEETYRQIEESLRAALPRILENLTDGKQPSSGRKTVR
jgi:protein-tyrosine phosphatase